MNVSLEENFDCQYEVFIKLLFHPKKQILRMIHISKSRFYTLTSYFKIDRKEIYYTRSF